MILRLIPCSQCIKAGAFPKHHTLPASIPRLARHLTVERAALLQILLLPRLQHRQTLFPCILLTMRRYFAQSKPLKPFRPVKAETSEVCRAGSNDFLLQASPLRVYSMNLHLPCRWLCVLSTAASDLPAALQDKTLNHSFVFEKTVNVHCKNTSRD